MHFGGQDSEIGQFGGHRHLPRAQCKMLRRENAHTGNFATQVANDGWAARSLPPTCATRCPAAGAPRARMQSSAGDFGGAPWEVHVLDLDERDLPTESTWDLASSLAKFKMTHTYTFRCIPLEQEAGYIISTKEMIDQNRQVKRTSWFAT